jgi:hypothetical protein
LQTNQIRQPGLAFCCTVIDFLDLGANIFLTATKYKFITSEFTTNTSTLVILPNLYI